MLKVKMINSMYTVNEFVSSLPAYEVPENIKG